MKKHYCIEGCEKIVSRGGKRCKSCVGKRRRYPNRIQPLNRIDVTIEKVKQMYLNEDKSVIKISRELNCYGSLVIDRLKRADIKVVKKIKLKKKNRCLDCEEEVNDRRTMRCRLCFSKKITKRRINITPLGKFINRINNLEMWRKNGFKKGIKHNYSGDTLIRYEKNNFKKGHKLNLGNKHPNWQGGISFEPYDSNFNQEFKDLIRKRDNFNCMKCDKLEYQELEDYKRVLAIHHINYDKQLTIKENCCVLCLKCNLEVNYKRKHWTKFFQSLLSEKYNYQYTELNEIKRFL